MNRSLLVAAFLALVCGAIFLPIRTTPPILLSSADDGTKAYGEVVWSWRRDAGAKSLRSKLLRGDGGKQARSPGRARYKP